MMGKKACACLLCVLCAAVWSCASFYFRRIEAPPGTVRIGTLYELPSRKLWQGFVFNGEKVGFSCLAIEPAPEEGQCLVTSEAELHILFLGAGKRISMKSEDILRPDLTLHSFRYRQTIDDKRLILEGRVRDGRLTTTQTLDGQITEASQTLDEPVYPASIINLYPAVKGMAIGTTYRFTVFDPQTRSLTSVSQSIVAFEESRRLGIEPSFKITTRMYDQEVTTWITPRGETVFELGMQGLLITHRESEAQARQYLVEAGFNKKDLVMDFSLVKTAIPLPCPRETTYLDIVLEGVAGELPPLSGPGQEAIVEGREGHETVRYRIDSDARAEPKRYPVSLNRAERRLYLGETPHIESTHPDIVKRAAAIAAGAPDSLAEVRRLTEWVSAEVADEAVDSSSALEVLRLRKGECQAHTVLYTALARAAGIPTRLVGGLLYLEERGFFYHSWAESYVDGWISVDPTLNQVGTDAAHIKLVEGPFWTSTLALGKVVGRVEARIMGFRDTCGSPGEGPSSP